MGGAANRSFKCSLKCFGADVVMLPVIVLVVAVLFTGCSQDSKKSMLGVFFTGVPAPGADETSSSGKKGKAFLHAPFLAGLCSRCHSVRSDLKSPSRTSASAGPDSQTLRLLAKPIQDLCGMCHIRAASLEAGSKPATTEWLHAPVAQGGAGCVMCHSPHESRFPFMLVTSRDKLCIKCHAVKDLQKTKDHQVAGVDDCLKCHNPHGGENRLLLKKDYKDSWVPPAPLFEKNDKNSQDMTR